jgi:hypothetical protein
MSQSSETCRIDSETLFLRHGVYLAQQWPTFRVRVQQCLELVVIDTVSLSIAIVGTMRMSTRLSDDVHRIEAATMHGQYPGKEPIGLIKDPIVSRQFPSSILRLHLHLT